MENQSQAKISFEFVTAAERTLAIARRLLASSDQDQRLVAAAMLDTHELSRDFQQRYLASIEKDGDFDFTPYFNHEIGDAIQAAKRLAKSDDSDLRDIARVLLDQAKAISSSRASFLDDVRRLHGPDVADAVGRGEWSPDGSEPSPSSLTNTNECRTAMSGSPIDSDDSSIRRPR